MVRRLLCLALCCQALTLNAQQADIAGFWDQPAPGVAIDSELFGFIEDANERADGPFLVDYMGIPLNEEALSRALTYDSALLGVPEHVCMRHPTQYSYWGPAALRIAAQLDDNLDVISYTVGGTFRRADRKIWMDGRPHPSEYAPHTWAGFTTGRWENGTLITRTTHLKWGWVRRNGVPSSDESEVITYYQRNGDVLTITWFVEDPHYLTDTYIRSADFVAAPQGIRTATFGVEAPDVSNQVFLECINIAEIPRPERHYVPHYLPGENPFYGDRAEELGIPVESTLGGEETAMPEYMERLAE
ncbi:MAG: hypothetical protein CMP91_10690 [Gammaproteobacteria bacterium]|nr:hypothetical protein [Gammaproteobacteria bacterium]MAY02194.1 hypothetical protein [Gammaproteobacteria bacterium]|tara:strand:+ start:76084 stop:76989 length:906 start_codon:yes stop_codon:yes gene_type:complete